MRTALNIVALVLLAGTATAQDSRLIGNWEGKLQAGREMRLVLRVEDKDGKLSATVGSPDQGVSSIPVSSVVMKGDSVFADISISGAKYMGLLQDSVIKGKWKQGGLELPLVLAKTDKPSEVVRPQTPKPPFNYISEDVSFTNTDKSISYGGTITIPRGTGKYPAMLLISGSGPQRP